MNNKHFTSMMDQKNSIQRLKRSNIIYVHDGSMEIIYIGKSKTKYSMSMIDQRKSYILLKGYQTFYVYDGSTEIVYTGLPNKKYTSI